MERSLMSVFVFVLAVACAFPAISLAARDLAPAKKGFVVQGRVFCDTCQAGFETPVSIYIRGAKVRVRCRSKATGKKTCSFDGTTDHTGTYNIMIEDEHEHEICESVAVSSPEMGCKSVLPGRDKARVYLTHNSGIASNTRYANALGFRKDTALPVCAGLMKTYEQYEV